MSPMFELTLAGKIILAVTGLIAIGFGIAKLYAMEKQERVRKLREDFSIPGIFKK